MGPFWVAMQGDGGRGRAWKSVNFRLRKGDWLLARRPWGATEESVF